jgi:hypothetical protein
MLSDWELWAVANRLVVDHRENAALEAARRIDAMLDAGDLDGRDVWRAVLRRIEALQVTGTRH